MASQPPMARRRPAAGLEDPYLRDDPFRLRRARKRRSLFEGERRAFGAALYASKLSGALGQAFEITLQYGNNRVAAEDVPTFLQTMHATVLGLASGNVEPEEAAPQQEHEQGQRRRVPLPRDLVRHGMQQPGVEPRQAGENLVASSAARSGASAVANSGRSKLTAP